MVHNILGFYGGELLAFRPNPKLEDHPLSTLRDCLLNIFATTLCVGGRSSIRNPEDAPYRVDRGLLIMGVSLTIDFYLVMG
jgi:hypothetical protein